MSENNKTHTPGFEAFRRTLLTLAISQAIATTGIAATITVDDPGDPGNATTCTLRQALAAANSDLTMGACSAGSGADVIDFHPSLNGQTITLTNGALIPSSEVTIQGPGPDNLTVSGGGADIKLFWIFENVFNLSGLALRDAENAVDNRSIVSLADTVITGATGGAISNSGSLTIANSTIADNTTPYSGAGIFSQGDLTITGSTISGNTADQMNQGSGAGIAHRNGVLTIIDSVIENNVGRYVGGVASSNGTATIQGSTIRGNSALFDSAIRTSGSMTISDTTINDNTSDSMTIRAWPVSEIQITNSTISGNSAGLSGGLYVANGTTATLDNVTIAGNTGTVATLDLDNAILNLTNSIIANTTGGMECTVDAGSQILIHVNNIIESGNCVENAIGLQVVDPLLGPLKNNGGPTPTHAPLVGSPAVDMGDNLNCPINDQRGVARDDGFCDIGAVEGVDPQVFLDGFESDET